MNSGAGTFCQVFGVCLGAVTACQGLFFSRGGSTLSLLKNSFNNSATFGVCTFAAFRRGGAPAAAAAAAAADDIADEQSRSP